MTAYKRWRAEKRHKAKMNLLAKCLREVAPKIAELNKRWDLMESSTCLGQRGFEEATSDFQAVSEIYGDGQKKTSGKYFTTFGQSKDDKTDLASENSSCWATMQALQKRAELAAV